jgi:ketosteroid isomerase-like protein
VSANEDTVRQGYDAFSKGDTDTLRSIMTADVVHFVPGQSQISGEYKGIDNVLGYYQKLFELTGGNLSVDIKSVTSEGPDTVVVIHHNKAQREGKTYDSDEKLTFTFSGDKIARLEESHDNLAEWDAFWGKS